MTNQEPFKKDTTELYDSIKNYLQKYRIMGGSRMLQSPGELFLAQLRIALEIVRTDEENKHQSEIDGYC